MGATVLSNPRAVNESLMPLLCNAENAASVHPTTTQYSVTRDSAHLGVCCGSNSTLLMSLLQVWHTTPSFGTLRLLMYLQASAFFHLHGLFIRRELQPQRQHVGGVSSAIASYSTVVINVVLFSSLYY